MARPGAYCRLGRAPAHPFDQGPGRDGFKPVVAGSAFALPGLRFTIEDVVAEHDRVAVRSTIATIGPTKRPVQAAAFDFHRLTGDGLIAETWHLEDRAALGARPDPCREDE